MYLVTCSIRRCVVTTRIILKSLPWLKIFDFLFVTRENLATSLEEVSTETPEKSPEDMAADLGMAERVLATAGEVQAHFPT
jgi:hypothetical protein